MGVGGELGRGRGTPRPLSLHYLVAPPSRSEQGGCTRHSFDSRGACLTSPLPSVCEHSPPLLGGTGGAGANFFGIRFGALSVPLKKVSPAESTRGADPKKVRGARRELGERERSERSHPIALLSHILTLYIAF